jgi:hypothetical protein
MRKSRFSEDQIIGVLREQQAGARTEEVCRRHGISTTMFDKWKARYGGQICNLVRPTLPRDRSLSNGQVAPMCWHSVGNGAHAINHCVGNSHVGQCGGNNSMMARNYISYRIYDDPVRHRCR